MQQCEEKQPPDTTWRSKQPHGKVRWREVRLIIDRIKELQVTSGSISAALVPHFQMRHHCACRSYGASRCYHACA